MFVTSSTKTNNEKCDEKLITYLEERGSKRLENELSLRNLWMVPKADPSITPYG